MNNELILIDKEIFVSSRVVAERYGKKTYNVNQKIRSIMEIDDINTAMKTNGSELDDLKIIFSKYSDESGKENVDYLINEELCMELIMGFTGKEAREKRVQFRTEFKEMREQLKNIANNSPKAFIDSLHLTKYGIENYLPKFLTPSNCKVVIPLLLTRVMDEVEKGNIKIEVLTVASRVTKKIIDTLDDDIEARLMQRELDKLKLQLDRTKNSSLGGLSTSNKNLKDKLIALEEKCNLLENDKWTPDMDEEFSKLVKETIKEQKYIDYRNSYNTYRSYICNTTSEEFHDVSNYYYKSIYIKIPKAKECKDAGYDSKLHYLYFNYPKVCSDMIRQMYLDALKLGYRDE